MTDVCGVANLATTMRTNHDRGCPWITGSSILYDFLTIVTLTETESHFQQMYPLSLLFLIFLLNPLLILREIDTVTNIII